MSDPGDEELDFFATAESQLTSPETPAPTETIDDAVEKAYELLATGEEYKETSYTFHTEGGGRLILQLIESKPTEREDDAGIDADEDTGESDLLQKYAVQVIGSLDDTSQEYSLFHVVFDNDYSLVHEQDNSTSAQNNPVASAKLHSICSSLLLSEQLYPNEEQLARYLMLLSGALRTGNKNQLSMLRGEGPQRSYFKAAQVCLNNRMQYTRQINHARKTFRGGPITLTITSQDIIDAGDESQPVDQTPLLKVEVARRGSDSTFFECDYTGQFYGTYCTSQEPVDDTYGYGSETGNPYILYYPTVEHMSEINAMLQTAVSHPATYEAIKKDGLPEIVSHGPEIDALIEECEAAMALELLDEALNIEDYEKLKSTGVCRRIEQAFSERYQAYAREDIPAYQPQFSHYKLYLKNSLFFIDTPQASFWYSRTNPFQATFHGIRQGEGFAYPEKDGLKEYKGPYIVCTIPIPVEGSTESIYRTTYLPLKYATIPVDMQLARVLN